MESALKNETEKARPSQEIVQTLESAVILISFFHLHVAK